MAFISNGTTMLDAGAFSVSLGAMTHIKTLTASNSADLTFVHGSSSVVLDSTYPIYLFKFITMHASATNAHFSVNFRDGGSSYDATKTTTYVKVRHGENASLASIVYDDGNDLAQSTADQMIGQEIATDNDASGSGELWLFNPSSTTYVKHFMAHFSHHYTNSAPGCIDNWTAGYINTTTAIDGIQFKFASGNIDTGTFKLYGIKDS